ncbi:MAG: thioesterase family protein [Thermoanaerobaculia bacterium]
MSEASGGNAAVAAGWPVALAVPLAWGEMDAYGHVNNAVYFRWFESARMEYFRRLGWPELQAGTGIGPILHSTQARFRAALAWPDTVTVATRVTDVRADRFTMHYEVRSATLGRVAAEGSGLIVAFDYRSLAKAKLPQVIVERIAALERG